MKNNYSKLSVNELNETVDLCNQLQNSIKRVYLHVAENLPKSILKDIEKTREQLLKELDKRYEND